MGFTGFNVIISDITYYVYLMEIDKTGNLCIAFARDENDEECKLYSTNFLSDTRTWIRNNSTQNTPVKMCCSFTETNGDFYVYRMLDNTSSNETLCFILSYDIITGLYSFSSVHIPIADTTPTDFTPYAMSTNDFGSALAISTSNGIYLVNANTNIVPNNNNNYLFSATYKPSQISCSNTSEFNGLIIYNGNMGYYYISGGTIFIDVFLSGGVITNQKLLSNLKKTTGKNNIGYATDTSNIIYQINYNTSVPTSITITQFSSSYLYSYNHLKIYNIDNFIFSSSTCVVYSINGSVSTYNDASGFTWCAISDLDNNIIDLCACNNSTKIYLNTEFICFLKNTKITIFENNEEIEKKVELLKIGDLIKINQNEYKKINFIGYRKIDTTEFLDVIRVLPKDSLSENLPYENLYLTSGHSLLFKDLENANEFYNKDVYDNNIEDYYKIMTQHCKLCNKVKSDEILNLIEDEKYATVYHFSLESDNLSSQYAIYSNGIRSECMSYEFALKSKLITK